jgi:DHA1 family bicyclomycin/chloramphenicol resistance-like MFS transporter
MFGSQLSGRAAGRQSPTKTVKRAYVFMVAAAAGNFVYALLLPPALPWAVIPLMIYGIGFAMAMPSVTLITLDLFPTRRGMAASLQGFVSGMVNVVNAGVISPAVSHDTRWLAAAMALLLAAGILCWWLYTRSARRRGTLLETLPGIPD